MAQNVFLYSIRTCVIVHALQNIACITKYKNEVIFDERQWITITALGFIIENNVLQTENKFLSHIFAN